jgi:hypothetical protein
LRPADLIQEVAEPSTGEGGRLPRRHVVEKWRAPSTEHRAEMEQAQAITALLGPTSRHDFTTSEARTGGRLRGVHDDCRAVLIRTDRRYGSQSRRSARRACRPRVNTGSTDPTALGGSDTGGELRGTRPIPGISGQGRTQRYSARRPCNPMVVGSSHTRPMCRTACESLSPASASVPSTARRRARGQSVGHRARRGR